MVLKVTLPFGCLLRATRDGWPGIFDVDNSLGRREDSSEQAQSRQRSEMTEAWTHYIYTSLGLHARRIWTCRKAIGVDAAFLKRDLGRPYNDY